MDHAMPFGHGFCNGMVFIFIGITFLLKKIATSFSFQQFYNVGYNR